MKYTKGLFFVCILLSLASLSLYNLKTSTERITFVANGDRSSQSLNYLKLPKTLSTSCWKKPCQLQFKDTAPAVKWKMIFFVKSALSHLDFREIVRKTWASLSFVNGTQLATIFILGRPNRTDDQILIEEEQARYGDILQFDETDEYRYISQKTLVGMQWASENLDDDVYYTSCDDDFMIDIGGLIEKVNKLKDDFNRKKWPDFPIICAHGKRVNSSPSRDLKSKWLEPKEEYKWPFWPAFCLGGAYTTSVGVIRQLFEASRGVEPLRMDDVWVTGVLREKIGMPSQYIKGVRTPLAKHYEGYAKLKDKRRQRVVARDWTSVYKHIEDKTVCSCEVYLGR